MVSLRSKFRSKLSRRFSSSSSNFYCSSVLLDWYWSSITDIYESISVEIEMKLSRKVDYSLILLLSNFSSLALYADFPSPKVKLAEQVCVKLWLIVDSISSETMLQSQPLSPVLYFNWFTIKSATSFSVFLFKMRASESASFAFAMSSCVMPFLDFNLISVISESTPNWLNDTCFDCTSSFFRRVFSRSRIRFFYLSAVSSSGITFRGGLASVFRFLKLVDFRAKLPPLFGKFTESYFFILW